MNHKLAKEIYESIVLENVDLYRKLYDEDNEDDNIIEYWKSALSLYNTFDESQKEIFFSIIKTVITDTVSNTLGIFDGSLELSGDEWEFKVSVNNTTVDNDLQDAFLEYVETIEA